jgi:hypothetical protein
MILLLTICPVTTTMEGLTSYPRVWYSLGWIACTWQAWCTRCTGETGSTARQGQRLINCPPGLRSLERVCGHRDNNLFERDNNIAMFTRSSSLRFGLSNLLVSVDTSLNWAQHACRGACTSTRHHTLVQVKTAAIQSRGYLFLSGMYYGLNTTGACKDGRQPNNPLALQDTLGNKTLGLPSLPARQEVVLHRQARIYPRSTGICTCRVFRYK